MVLKVAMEIWMSIAVTSEQEARLILKLEGIPMHAPLYAQTIESHFECQFKSLNDLARAQAERDPVMIEHYKVEATCDFEIVATSCLQSFENLTGRYMKCRIEMLLSDAAIDPFPISEKLLSLLDQAREACEACLTLSDISRSWGHPLECGGRLLSALGEIDAKATEIRDNWPIMDREMMDISRHNHERGHAKDAEEVFSAIQTQDTGKP